MPGAYEKMQPLEWGGLREGGDPKGGAAAIAAVSVTTAVLRVVPEGSEQDVLSAGKDAKTNKTKWTKIGRDPARDVTSIEIACLHLTTTV